VKNIFLLASLLMLFISACSSDSGSGSAASAGRGSGGSDSGAGNEEVAMSVEGHKVSRRLISEYVITNTTLESIREVIVYSKVSAMVTERHFEEGDIVKQGDLLVKLHDDEIINNLEQSKIALTQTEVAIMQAEVNAELSAADFKRVKSLYDQKLISQQEYDQSEIASRSDTLSLDNVKRQLEAAKSRLAAAEIQVAYTTVKSPITGVVTARTVNIGDRLSSNQQLLTIQEFPPLWARIHIPEISIPKIKVGQLAKMQMEAYSEREFSGRIKLISPTVEAESGTIKVTIEVKKDTHLLRPGMFGTVYIATDSHENAVVIPKKSIIRERNTNYVYTINSDNTVTRQEVTIGFSDEDQVEIAEGLQGNEAIVTVGQETLSDGYPVIVQTWSDGVDGSDVLAAQASKSAEPGTGTSSLLAEAQTDGPPPVMQGGERTRPPGDQSSDRFMQMVEANPALKKAWDKKVKEDPEVATDPEKRRAAIREIMTEMRGSGDAPMPRRGMGGGRP
jgi:membrane fusion protein, multidrug efflux system